MIWKTCLFTLLAISYCDAHSRTGSLFKQISSSLEELEKDFNKTHAVVEGGSIFIQKLNSSLWAEANEKKILLGQLISMYSELLKTILKNKHSRHVKDIVAALEVYKTHYSDGMKKAEDLLQLAKLPMNDAKIELKAIMELRTVLLELNKEEVRRKRRSRAQNPRPNLSG